MRLVLEFPASAPSLVRQRMQVFACGPCPFFGMQSHRLLRGPQPEYCLGTGPARCCLVGLLESSPPCFPSSWTLPCCLLGPVWLKLGHRFAVAVFLMESLRVPDARHRSDDPFVVSPGPHTWLAVRGWAQPQKRPWELWACLAQPLAWKALEPSATGCSKQVLPVTRTIPSQRLKDSLPC